MDPGRAELSLNVASVRESLAFYQRLGFSLCEGNPDEGWAVVELGDTRIGLYKGMVAENSLTFLGGDVEAIASKLVAEGATLESGPTKEGDGSTGAAIRDPDGNLIYFNS